MSNTDAAISDILGRTRVIACVGVSPNPVRPSHYVARYLGLKGYRVIPVNPLIAGQALLGETAVGRLADIPPDAMVDLVDIFRRSEEVGPVVDEALEVLPHLRTIWMQLGISNPEAAARARARGITVIENRCPKIEYQRLSGELRMAGVNTGRVSSRLRPWP